MSGSQTIENNTPSSNSSSNTPDKEETYEESEAKAASPMGNLAWDEQPLRLPLLLSDAFIKEELQYQGLYSYNEENNQRLPAKLNDFSASRDVELSEKIGKIRADWLSKELNKFVDGSLQPWLHMQVIKMIPETEIDFKEKRCCIADWFMMKLRDLFAMKIEFDLIRAGDFPLIDKKNNK